MSDFPGEFVPATRSTWVRGYRYDPAGRRLQVRFRSGVVCEYANIDESTYDDMFSAASLGKFVHDYLVGRLYTVV